jgi:small-conductance mechanosensitive channel
LNRGIYKAFDQARIVIPFPQRDVYVHSQRE